MPKAAQIGDKSIKEEAFVQAVADTLNPTEAVRQVYKPKSDNYAYVMSNRLMRKVKIQKSIVEELEKKRVTNSRVAQEIRTAITKPAKELPTWSEKHSFIKTFLQVTGQLEQSGPSVNVGIRIER